MPLPALDQTRPSTSQRMPSGLPLPEARWQKQSRRTVCCSETRYRHGCDDGRRRSQQHKVCFHLARNKGHWRSRPLVMTGTQVALPVGGIETVNPPSTLKARLGRQHHVAVVTRIGEPHCAVWILPRHHWVNRISNRCKWIRVRLRRRW